MSGLTVLVLVDGWQFGCCADPPGVGDEVAWRLEWRDYLATVLGPAPRTTMTLPVRRLPPPPASDRASVAVPARGAVEETVPAIAELGNLTVYWPSPVPMPATVTIDGVLHEDHHIDIPVEVPRTPGVIRRVRVVSWQYERDAQQRYWRPVDGTEILTDVHRSPKYLGGTTPLGATVYRDDNSVLVDLEVMA
jgi:hypothetical protein